MKSAGIDAAMVVAVVLASAFVAGCAHNSSSADIYPAFQAQNEQTVRTGTIESVRGVRIQSNDGQPSGLGTLGGGALGAVAGSAIGGGRGSVLAGIAGGLAGAIIGDAIENGVAVRPGLELTVRLDNGELRAITQADTGEAFRAGDRVRLLSAGGVTRVTH